MAEVILKKGRERSLARHHPWIFSGAIDYADDIEPGGIVRVLDSRERPLAVGYFNAASKIQVRVLDWNADVRIDGDWWRRRIERSLHLRQTVPGGMESDAQRLVFAEADGLPGLIVDRYGTTVVFQVLTAGIERVKGELVDSFTNLLVPTTIYERSDGEARALEGLAPAKGTLSGEPVDGPIEIAENILKFLVDIENGHKTGFYVDQRWSRRRVAGHSSGGEVLDLFSYTGAFSVYALTAGATRATLVDSSGDAIELARRNADLNGVGEKCEFVQGNAFEVVRDLQRDGRHYDLVICDPPKLAPSKGQLAKAERAYKDINMNAMKLTKPGGVLATFSCSAALRAGDLSKILAWSAIDAGRQVRILRRLSQGPDHPVDPCFPESEYLKGFVCRVE